MRNPPARDLNPNFKPTTSPSTTDSEAESPEYSSTSHMSSPDRAFSHVGVADQSPHGRARKRPVRRPASSETNNFAKNEDVFSSTPEPLAPANDPGAANHDDEKDSHEERALRTPFILSQ